MNKQSILLTLCIFITGMLSAQKTAITDDGEEVILYEDGKWEYKNSEDVKEVEEISTNKTKFKTPSGSTFLLKSKVGNFGFKLNPKKWSFKKSKADEDSEYELSLKGKDLYSMIITEETEIPIMLLRSIALENARSVASDMKIDREEYRIVNGNKVLLLQMSGTMQGLKFTYFGYYFSNENGTLQYLTYSAANLMPKYKKECEELLNGFIIRE